MVAYTRVMVGEIVRNRRVGERFRYKIDSLGFF